MLKNNNKNVVKRLSSRSLTSNRMRNIFAIAAILLTTYMITTVFSIGISLTTNLSIMNVRQQGTKASIYLNNPTDEQYKQIEGLEFLENVGTQIMAGSIRLKNADGKDIAISMAYYNNMEWEKHYQPAISDIKGTYPQKELDIMLSESTLNQIGITDPKIGMVLDLPVNTENGSVTKKFILSGWFVSYVNSDSTGLTAFISEDYCKSNGLTIEKSGTLSISCKSGKQKEAFSNMEKEITLKPNQEIIPTFDINEENSSNNTMMIVFIVVIALFIVLSGYLLIYNVLYISVTKDIQFYGMLKTIGTSPKQIRKIVKGQVWKLSGIGIPIGLALGAATSFILVPFGMSVFTAGRNSAMPTDISFNPLIFAGTAIFALLTVFLSCHKPAKFASKVSPMEALRYSGEAADKKIKNHKSTNGGKLYKMAYHNVFRGKKRAMLVFASLFMGAITFLAVYSFFGSLDMQNYIDKYYPKDFELSSMPPLNQRFDADFMKAIHDIDGVETVETVSIEPATMKFDEKLYEPFLKYYYNDYKDSADIKDYQEFLEPFSSGKTAYGTNVYKINREQVEEYNKTSKYPVDVEAFMDGEIGIIGDAYYMESDGNIIGSTIDLTSTSSKKMKGIKIAGISDGNIKASEYSTAIGTPSGIYVSEAFMKEFNPDPTVVDVVINVDARKEKQIKAEIIKLTNGLVDQNFVLDIKTDTARDFENTMNSINLLTGGISILLILVGILNLINVMLTGVYTRRRELAIMESIGMTKKQISKMLMYEGIYYGVITTALIMTLGNGILYLISRGVTKIADYAVFNYPYTLLTILVTVILIICAVVPIIVYKTVSKMSVTERIRAGNE